MDDRALRATIGLSASEFNQLVHPDIFTLGTYLLLFLLCLTTDAPLTVKHIFEDNLNWAGFRLAEKDNLRDVEIFDHSLHLSIGRNFCIQIEKFIRRLIRKYDSEAVLR